jgi:ubiquinone/menaquinone biosynthesis C-methylase UbiE
MVQVEKQIRTIEEGGFSVARASVGRLYQLPGTLLEITKMLKNGIASDEEAHVKRAAQAIASWSRAYGTSLLPMVPDEIVNLVLARFALRHEPKLVQIIECLLRIVEENAEKLTSEQTDPPEAVEDAFRKLTRADTPTLIERNRAVHRMLVDGIDRWRAGGKEVP